MRKLFLPAVAVALVACSREMAVPAARPLTLTPATASVAPREKLTLAAGGGAGGYAFAFSGTPGSGADATIDPATGAYRAGSTGAAADVIVVSDLAGQTATATVTVGAALTISSEATLVVPGGHATFTADGGLPPYTFRFQAKGNRSGGSIDAVTGEYTAGPNPGAQDKLEVFDAAGAVTQAASSVTVGSLHLPLPGGAAELELGDLNGDGRLDVVALEPAGAATRMTTVLLLPGGTVVGDTYFLKNPNGISALDMTGDGRAEVFAGMMANSTLFTPDAGGRLDVADALGWARVPRLPLAVATTGTCTGGAGIYGLVWNAGTASLDPPGCVTAVPYPSYTHVADILPGDFDQAGATTQVAWLERDDVTVPYQPAGTPQLHFAASTGRLLGMPAAGWSAVLPNGGQRQQLVGGSFRGGLLTDTAVLLQNPSGRNVIKVVPSFQGTSPAWVATELDPFPGKAPALGLVRCPKVQTGGSDTAVTWNGTLKPVVVEFSGAGVPSLSAATAASVRVPITVGACGDVNGDGIPDLALASNSTSTLALVWGDGDGGFGRRAHFQAPNVYTMAQVDGDGIGDVIVATDVPSLVTLLGDEHQLARVAETPLSFAPAGIWAGNLGSSTVAGWSGDLVVADSSSNVYRLHGSTAGVFGRASQIRAAPDASGRIPRIVRVAFANLGGSPSGDDVVVLYEIEPPRIVSYGHALEWANGTYELDAIVRTSALRGIEGTPKVITYQFTGTSADVQPADLDGDGVDELVAVEGITTINSGGNSEERWRPRRLHVDPTGAGTMTLVGPLPGYTVGTRPAAVGRQVVAGGDVAVLAGGMYADLVWGADAVPTVVVSAIPGSLSVPGPRTIGNVTVPVAFLGPVTTTTAPDLVFADTSRNVRVFPGQLTGGRLTGFGTPTVAVAPGIVAGIVPQGGTTRSDVLMFTGEDLVPLVWSGTTLK